MKNVKAFRFIMSRLLPKTGQTIVYAAGDDGDYQAGWWRGKSLVNNKTRFIAKTIDGDDVVFDKATGLMWPIDGSKAGCNNGDLLIWSDCLAYAANLSFAGHSDWRIPNIKELISLVNYGRNNPTLYTDYFANIAYTYYWSSTTSTVLTTSKWCISFKYASISVAPNSTDLGVFCVRGGI